MVMPLILELVEPGIGLLMVKRPDVRNALNWEAMEAFSARVEEAHQLDELMVLILTGYGKSFIAGGDLKELHGFSTEADGRRLGDMMRTVLNRLEALPCPTIAAINGPARGGGAEVALACDLRVMETGADIGLVQVTLGLTPGWGAGGRLLRLVGYSRALELLTTGRVLGAEEALVMGLVNQVAPVGEGLEEAIALARRIATQPLATVQAIKRLLRAGVSMPPETASAVEQAEFPPLWASEEHLKAVEHFLNRRKE
jgi:enoyl-CoA hydratase